jgi:small multidrug resistance family-3 protein
LKGALDIRTAIFLILAATLEVGGDALVRWGLKGGRVLGLVLGAAALFSYGLTVNLTTLDFGKLMGLYIAVFFVVAQAMAILFFHETLPLPGLVGGALIVTGGLLMTLWRVS